MKILLAVDGSDHSYEAGRSLQYLSRAEELHIVHVLDVPRPAYPMMIPEVAQELYETVERNMHDDGTRLLDRIVSLLPLDVGPVTKHLVVGSPADQIVALAEQLKVGLILLGTRGHGLHHRFLVREARCDEVFSKDQEESVSHQAQRSARGGRRFQ